MGIVTIQASRYLYISCLYWKFYKKKDLKEFDMLFKDSWTILLWTYCDSERNVTWKHES